METEAEYEEWFDEYLSNFESIYGESTIFDYCPRAFNIKRCYIVLIGLTILFILIGFFFYEVNIEFLVSISLSISTGLIVNLIFLIITSKKEKNINYYSNILPILQKRRNQLAGAYYNCYPYMSIAYQQNDKEKWFKYWHRLVNLAMVAIEFNNFLIDKMPKIYKYNDKDKMRDICDKLTELNNTATDLINLNPEIDFKKLNNECEDYAGITFNVSRRIDALIESIQFDLFKKMYKD